MTPEQNKNLILNNLSNYIFDKRGDFVNLEKDYDDNGYIIWKNEVKDYEEVREKVIKEIIRDKSRWSNIPNKEILEDIMESILLDKGNWEIVYDDWWIEWDGSLNEKFYKYRPTGEKVSAVTFEIFNWDQNYILLGELGHRENIHEDYDQWGHYRAKEWWGIRNWKKKQKTKNKPPINPPPVPPQENQKYEASKKKPKRNDKNNENHFKKKLLKSKLLSVKNFL